MTKCARCGRRDIAVKSGRYRVHAISLRDNGSGHCPMSELPVPVDGHSDADYEAHARIVTELACRLQVADPVTVWEWLTTVDAGELQRLLVIALAALDTDKTVSELWGWVAQLPVARLAC